MSASVCMVSSHSATCRWWKRDEPSHHCVIMVSFGLIAKPSKRRTLL